jgi:hypothetical protein
MKNKKDFDTNMDFLGIIGSIEKKENHDMIIADENLRPGLPLFEMIDPSWIGVPVKPLKAGMAAPGDVLWFSKESNRVFVSGSIDGDDMIELEPYLEAWSTNPETLKEFEFF